MLSLVLAVVSPCVSLSILILLPAILLGVLQSIRRKYFTYPTRLKIAIFHPYCIGGGGGERVLWVLVHALLRDLPLNSDISIFTGDRLVTDEAIYKHVEQKFSI